jgi:aspartate beta-hydroxylase
MHSTDDPRTLNTLGNAALSRGDSLLARQLLTAAADRAPTEPAIQFNLALACRACGDLTAAIRHYDLALAADPYFVHAMFEKGVTLEALNMPREAALTFKDLLDCAPTEVQRSPQFAAVLDHARSVVRRNDELLERVLEERLADPRRDWNPSRRVAECVGALLGKQPIYVQRPTFLHVPRLPALPFFDRASTPWLCELEAATSEIRAELQAILHSTSRDFVPYIEIPAGEPRNQWAALDRSLDWSALFFWRHGRRVERTCTLCPRTAAVLDALPMARIPGRSPNAFFSVLRPGTRIPPHTGVSNMRSVVHLPLIVPPGCGFRVGAERREWREGEAWVFDDTIEHEAWNDSTSLRAVLIFDTWNPLLDAAERADLCHVIEAIDAHYGRVLEWQDRP